jgi:hypothetical protein
MPKENLIGLMRDCLLKPPTNINDVSNPAYINLPASLAAHQREQSNSGAYQQAALAVGVSHQASEAIE